MAKKRRKHPKPRRKDDVEIVYCPPIEAPHDPSRPRLKHFDVVLEDRFDVLDWRTAPTVRQALAVYVCDPPGVRTSSRRRARLEAARWASAQAEGEGLSEDREEIRPQDSTRQLTRRPR